MASMDGIFERHSAHGRVVVLLAHVPCRRPGGDARSAIHKASVDGTSATPHSVTHGHLVVEVICRQRRCCMTNLRTPHSSPMRPTRISWRDSQRESDASARVPRQYRRAYDTVFHQRSVDRAGHVPLPGPALRAVHESRPVLRDAGARSQLRDRPGGGVAIPRWQRAAAAVRRGLAREEPQRGHRRSEWPKWKRLPFYNGYERQRRELRAVPQHRGDHKWLVAAIRRLRSCVVPGPRRQDDADAAHRHLQSLRQPLAANLRARGLRHRGRRTAPDADRRPVPRLRQQLHPHHLEQQRLAAHRAVGLPPHAAPHGRGSGRLQTHQEHLRASARRSGEGGLDHASPERRT